MIKQHLDKKTGRIHNLLLRSHEEKMTEYKCPKWEEVYTKELTLQALFEKLIDTENRMKDEVFILTERIDKLEGELK
jgi:hypothetical protein